MPRTVTRARSLPEPLSAFSPAAGETIDFALKTTLSSSYRELPRLRDWIDHLAEYAGMAPADRFELRLAAMEIFIHIIQEAYEGEESGIVKATMLIRGSEIRLVLRDFGRRPYSLSDEGWGVPSARGSHLFLIRRLVDEVKFHTSLPRGKAIEVLKRCSVLQAPRSEPAASATTTPALPAPPSAAEESTAERIPAAGRRRPRVTRPSADS
jgi:anti-sigma regulatory factor (Ser/Thr protein kinase)